MQLLPGSGASPKLDPRAEVCVVAPPTPYDPASGLALLAPRPVPADARCPVCGMYPARSRESARWAAQVIFDNGDAQFFDSPLSLFIYLRNVARYTRGRGASQIAASYVSDASSGAWLAANAAVYVQGSTATGPMRAGNLPAFADAAAAQRFMRERGGRLLRASEISPELLRRLDSGTHLDH
ncbi:hypothetical protein AT984_08265 [Paucibacter sp. KCTC 42545]|nr:hypothetical protein AT984_08265 [Paucibacter sp. KCTC 42545]